MTQQPSETPEGPFCQSCSMPMAEPDSFGTEADGSKATEYCSYCYLDGAFTSDISIEEMIDISAAGMSEATGTPLPEAQAMLKQILPSLKRWSAAA